MDYIDLLWVGTLRQRFQLWSFHVYSDLECKYAYKLTLLSFGIS